MCGIVGYVGRRRVQDLLLDELSKLEYVVVNRIVENYVAKTVTVE